MNSNSAEATRCSCLQGIGSHAAGLDRLFSEALACIVQALQAAAAAKQPLLTASSQHGRWGCLSARTHCCLLTAQC